MDPVGAAIYGHYFNKDMEIIHVDSNYTEDEEIDPSWFFRTYQEMPLLERLALDLCRGKILDAGAGAGCHALVLQNNNFDVVALDQSAAACEVMRAIGVAKVVHNDLFTLDEGSYDTILMLMNGAGIAGTLEGLDRLLGHLKSLLRPGGQILLDSSDISYLFEEEDGSVWMDLARDNYYGEMEYTVRYKEHVSTFPWLFVGFETLSLAAKNAGMNTECMGEGDENNFLARLTLS
jgi:SAM-dependent methyltransferase